MTTTNSKTITAVVAPGRTVVGNNGVSVGAGKKVTVLEDELALLVQRGFVLDKDGTVKRSAPPAVPTLPDK